MYGRDAKCARCGRAEIVMVGLEEYSRFVGGRSVDTEFPYLSEDQRGMLEYGRCRSVCVPWR